MILRVIHHNNRPLPQDIAWSAVSGGIHYRPLPKCSLESYSIKNRPLP